LKSAIFAAFRPPCCVTLTLNWAMVYHNVAFTISIATFQIPLKLEKLFVDKRMDVRKDSETRFIRMIPSRPKNCHST